MVELPPVHCFYIMYKKNVVLSSGDELSIYLSYYFKNTDWGIY